MTTIATSDLPPGYWADPATGAWCTLPWPRDSVEKAELLRSSLGPQVIAWAEGRTEEPGLIDYQTGKPWRYTDGQKRFLILWYALLPGGRYRFRSGVKRGAKGPIAHDTPVMTPDGWKRHGDLVVGDSVYAVDGSVTRVTALRPEVLEDCYRVTFRDGGSVVCTGSHRWPLDVFTGGAKRVRRVLTVDEMQSMGVCYERPLTTGKTKATKAGVARFRTLPSPAIEGSHVDLCGIDPYMLGYWLGDGDKDCSRITAHDADMAELLAEMDRLGVEHGEPTRTHGETCRVRFGRGTAHAGLRSLGVLNDKHIPPRVLRGSHTQRLSVLQGLVDSDGHVGKTGAVEISLSDERLAAGVYELAVTLGLMPTLTTGATALAGRAYSTRYRIKFTPVGLPVSRLPRKLARVRTEWRNAPQSRARTVVSIERVESVPARCLTVEHESHVYLVGAQNVPTCNTGKDPFGASLCLVELIGPSLHDGWDDNGRPVGIRHGFPLVQVMSNSEAQSKDVLRVANAMLSQDARDYYALDCGETRTIIKTGGRLEVPPSSEASAEGDPATFIMLNESHHMTESSGGHRVAAVARRNVGKSPATIQARMVEFTNAHRSGSDSVAEQSFLAWQHKLANPRQKQDILYDSIEADPNLRITIPDELELAIAQAYLDAPWTDLERKVDEVLDIRTSVADSIRYYLNGLAAAEDAWVDPGRFDALGSPRVVDDRERMAMFLDCSKSEDATALMLCRLSDMHVVTGGCWQQPQGWSEKRDGKWRVPREQVDATVREAMARYQVAWFGVDPSPAKGDDDSEALYWAPMIDKWHQDFRAKLPVPASRESSVLFDMRLSQPGGNQRMRNFIEAAELVMRWVDEDDSPPFSHDGDPRLRTHVHNAKRRPNQWGIGLGKVSRDSSHVVDLAVAMVGAVMGARIALNSGKVKVNAGSGRVYVSQRW